MLAASVQEVGAPAQTPGSMLTSPGKIVVVLT